MSYLLEDGWIADKDSVEPAWDVIVRKGWGPAFAAANVLRFLRRVDESKYCLELAQWYWSRLIEHATNANYEQGCSETLRWINALNDLTNELSQEEIALLRK